MTLWRTCSLAASSAERLGGPELLWPLAERNKDVSDLAAVNELNLQV
jgi:hypothetical protein